MPAGYMHQRYLSPTQVGFNAASIDTAADGNWIDCAGFNRCTILCFHDYAAATGVEFYLEVKDQRDVAHLMTVQTDDGSGVYTLDPWKLQRTTGADTYWEVYIERINALEMRIVDALGQGSPSGDALTASITLAYAGG